MHTQVAYLADRRPELRDAEDLSGRRAVECAVERGHTAAAAALHARGAGVRGGWLSARLVAAVRAGDVQAVAGLLAVVPDPRFPLQCRWPGLGQAALTASANDSHNESRPFSASHGRSRSTATVAAMTVIDGDRDCAAHAAVIGRDCGLNRDRE